MYPYFVNGSKIIPQRNYLFLHCRHLNAFDSFNFESVVFLELIDGTKTIDEIVNDVSKKFSVAENIVKNDINKLLSYLLERGYIAMSETEMKSLSPFEDFGVNTKIVHADIEITRKCNLRCLYCYAFAADSSDLPFERWASIIENLHNNGLRAAKISGGEPFLHNDIMRIIEFFSRILIVSINTNGSFITDKVAENLSTYNLQTVQVSLDGMTPDIHDEFRGKGSWNSAFNAINSLRRYGVPTRISFTAHEKNKHELQKLYHFAEKTGCEVNVEIMKPVGRGGAIARGNFIRDVSQLGLCSRVSPIYKMLDSLEVKCQASLGFVGISHDGMLKPCNLTEHFFSRIGVEIIEPIDNSKTYEDTGVYRKVEKACCEKEVSAAIGDLEYEKCILY